jgi:hypothetical protein
MNLEQYLVLNRFMHGLFGASSLEELKGALYGIREGPGADGQSFFYGALVGRAGLDAAVEARLPAYDRRVMDYEARLGQRRDGLHLRYFQYLALLYSEVYLDLLTEAPAGLLERLNRYLESLQADEAHLRDIPLFALDDLRRLAFFMATGSGKTLLMHAHIWQVLHYLEHGRHPEALVRRADGRHAFRSILLITPGEGLSEQHLREFRQSGILAAHISERRGAQVSYEPQVWVVETQKLAEEASGEGVSIPIESLLDENLVLVDEGHKGAGSEAQTWKDIQKRLSANGFLLEYSATFAQAIGGASKKDRQGLLAEYGKAILFDYSYRHFHNDGYGKAFRVLNLANTQEERAQELLVGGLLTFYQQVRLYQANREAFRPYNLETPLWVFIGSSVSGKAVYQDKKQSKSDVATVVAFLRRFLEDDVWSIGVMQRLLSEESGFRDPKTGQDLFADAWPYLRESPAEDLYDQITTSLFHGRGALQLLEIKSAGGEFGLRVSTPSAEAEQPYFGVIYIGDSSAFRRHLREHLSIDTEEDQFTPSLFGDIEHPDSRVFLLVGAKKFIEGWSSWRVSSMGLLNMGKGPGSQVIQLFGRGVRLKGRDLSLKRSEAIHGIQHPGGLSHLETLQIFGWNADYIAQFRQMIEREGLMDERTLPVQAMEPWPELFIPQLERGYSAEQETWRLTSEPPRVLVDLRPRVAVYDGAVATAGETSPRPLQWNKAMPLLDLPSLYLELLEHKQTRGYHNLYLGRSVLPAILEQCSVLLPEEDLRRPDRIQEAAATALRTYVDRLYARRERAAQSQHLEPGLLSQTHGSIIDGYQLRISDAERLSRIQALLASGELMQAGGPPLPRLHVDFHLYNPLLLQAGHGADGIAVSPPGLNEAESRFVQDLCEFWKRNHTSAPYDQLEVYLLRNLPRVGVGYFVQSGFYPDFVLWTRDKESGHVRVVFVEPHGMHHGGLSGNADKIDALHALYALGQTKAFQDKSISLDGYILTDTPREQMPGAETMGWEELAKKHRVLPLGRACVETVLRGVD